MGREISSITSGIPSAHWRVFSTVEGGTISTIGDTISPFEALSTVEDVQYYSRGNIFNKIGHTISKLEGVQYCRGIPLVL